MADKNQLKIADQVDLADDDPFAELTRIMGFDPRQPARQAAPAAAPASHEGAPDEDDFSLDLEKELLGSFDLEEEQTGPADEPSFDAHELDAAPEMREPEAPETDFDFSAALDEALAVTSDATGPVESEAEPFFGDDFESAFAAAATEDQGDAIEEDEGSFDIGLTDNDSARLDATPPLPVTPEAVADFGIGAELDAAMADLLAEAPAEVEVAPPPQEAEDFDPGLFDESDFRIDDELDADEPSPEIAAQSAPQPEVDASAFKFDELFRPDEETPAGELIAATQDPREEFSFDELDFGDSETTAQDPVEEAPEAVKDSPSEMPEPAANFELSEPPYLPRKLPTSPMDVAAEEYRQRGPIEQPEPDFNLEDELNALLGNSKTKQAPVEIGAPAVSVGEPWTSQTTAYESAVSDAFRPLASTVFGSAARAEPVWDRGAPEEPVGVQSPEHPADIHDDLNWDLEDTLSETSPETAVERHAEDMYAQSDETEEFVEGGQFEAYGEPHERDGAYVTAFEAEEEPALVELDDDFVADGLDDNHPTQSPYREALAGAAISAAAGYGSSFARRPLQAAAPGSEANSFSPHRDPVVRGNPLKEDPLDVITQLAEKYSRKEPATPYGSAMNIAEAASPAAYGPEEEVEALYSSEAFEAPDVETVEVADQAIALADDLDIPELPEEEELPPVSDYDDLDAEFSSLLNEMNAEAQQARKPAESYGDPLAGGFRARPYENNVMAAPHGAHAAAAATYGAPAEAAPYALDADDLPGSRIPAGARYAADDYEYDPDLNDEIVPEHLAGEDRQKPRSRGLLLAGLIGGVALLGGVGAFVLSFGGGDEAPAIVKADDGPVKVRPAEPGGATVPNQESKVYETVAGDGSVTDAPQQETLVTTAEEPMDVMPTVDDEPLATASGKSEDRIEQIVQEAANQTDDQIVAVAPRKVRTLVVKPDGTLVPREDESGAAATEQTEAIAAATPAASVRDSRAALPSETADSEPSPALAPPAEEAQASAVPSPAPQEAGNEPEGQSQITAAMPETVPIAPLRPADQPIDVVGEVKPDQVAAATTAAAGSGWAMQIASQPTEAAARASYESLARRYGGVLEGREINIVKAEIPGKGTFWRVRVPAESRNEAINLCERYKSAGGNCFVSR